MRRNSSSQSPSWDEATSSFFSDRSTSRLEPSAEYGIPISTGPYAEEYCSANGQVNQGSDSRSFATEAKQDSNCISRCLSSNRSDSSETIRDSQCSDLFTATGPGKNQRSGIRILQNCSIDKKKKNPNKIKANQRTYAEATKLSVPEMESSSNQSSATMKTIASDTSTHSEVKKAPTSQQTLVSRLEKSNTTEEKLNLLLRSVRPQTDQPKIIMSTIMSLNLRSNVRSTPMVAWKAAVKAWSGKDPLLISLFAPGKAEIFYEFKDTEDIFRVPAGCKIFQAEVTKKDVPRRARAYLHGYYKELRRAACLGFDFESKKLLLEQASKLLPTMFHSKDIRQRWEKTIAYDLSQLQED
jgi:hypothetical protein